MESAILFGNGFNRIAGNGMSWEKLLMDLAKVSQLPSDSNTLNYECIFMDICNGGWKLGKESVVQTEFGLKCQIADACRDFRSGLIYEELAHLPISVYLTTNYDGVLDRTLVKMGYEYDRNASCTTESIYSIRRCHAYQKPYSGMDKRIFPIHGEHAVPKSIMIGYDHYCGSLGKLDDFFKGNYAYTQNEQVIKLPKLTARLKDKEKRLNMGMYWPDYFFTHNMHIIGLGLQLVETDLWWVLNKRSRTMHFTDAINNEIYFYGNPNDDTTNLLNAFGVKVVRVPTKEPKGQAEWDEAYRIMMAEMQKRIEMH